MELTINTKLNEFPKEELQHAFITGENKCDRI